MEAREKLIVSKMRFVDTIVRDFDKSYNITNNGIIDLDDLKSYGYEGLVYAIDNYKLESEQPLEEYIKNCVLDTLYQEISQFYGLSVEEYKRFLIFQTNIMSFQKLADYPDKSIIDEMAKFIFEKKKSTLALSQACKNLIMLSFSLSLTLKEPLVRKQEILEDLALKDAYNSELRDEITNILEVLTPREKEVLKDCFGLDTGFELTHKEIGLRFNRSISSISRIKQDAITKIKRPGLARHLKDFW